MRPFFLCSQIKDSTILGFFQFVAAKIFLRSPSEGVAEGGGWGEEFRHARAFRRAKRGGYVRFRFLDLCIRFGKMISKVCEGFNSGALIEIEQEIARFLFYSLGFFAVRTFAITWLDTSETAFR